MGGFLSLPTCHSAPPKSQEDSKRSISAHSIVQGTPGTDRCGSVWLAVGLSFPEHGSLSADRKGTSYHAELQKGLEGKHISRLPLFLQQSCKAGAVFPLY